MARFCSRCGARLNSDAEFCSSCGARASSSSDDSQVKLHDAHSFCCPRCNSENVQSLPVIYQSGTSGSSELTTADKFIAVTEGKTMTDLARSVAPPTKKEDNWWLVSLFGVGAYFFFDRSPLLALCSGAFCCYFIKVNIDIMDYNEKIWPAEYEKWLHSYLCHRCGNIFVI